MQLRSPELAAIRCFGFYELECRSPLGQRFVIDQEVFASYVETWEMRALSSRALGETEQLRARIKQLRSTLAPRMPA